MLKGNIRNQNTAFYVCLGCKCVVNVNYKEFYTNYQIGNVKTSVLLRVEVMSLQALMAEKLEISKC